MTELPNPPAWAQTLLAIMVAPDAHDGIAGDLIEEFRADKVPQLGIVRANRWYSAQVAHYVWRATRVWMAWLGLLFIAGDLSNQFRRADGTQYVSLASPIPILAPVTFLAVGFFTGRRTRSVAAGLLTAAVIQCTLLAFMAFWWNVTLYPVARLIQDNPYWINAWHYSGNGESFLEWSFYDNIGAIIMATLVLLPSASLFGTIGAAAGKLTASLTTSGLKTED